MAVATGVIGGGVGLAKFFEGRAMQKRAQNNIDNFKFEDLTNSYKNLRVSTLGSDLQTEQANINTASTTDALRAGGTRALVGGLGRQQALNNTMNREIAAGLDEKQTNIDFAAAGQDARNQVMVEKRQTDELAGFGAQLGAGQQLKFGGLADIAGTALAVGQTDFGAAVDKGIGKGVFGKDFMNG
jgi:hypothetical protein